MLHMYSVHCSPTKSTFIKAKYQRLAFVPRLPCKDDDTITVSDLSQVIIITSKKVVRRGLNGLCAGLRIEWSLFKPWPGSLCCVLGQDTYSHSACLHSGV